MRLVDSLMASASAAGEGSRLEDGPRAWELRWALELANTALNQVIIRIRIRISFISVWTLKR